MKEMGFELVVADYEVNDFCWDQIGKIGKSYKIKPFKHNDLGDLGTYLLDNGFKLEK